MRIYTNTASAATLAAAAGATDTTITLSTVAGWPVPLSGQEALAQIEGEVLTYSGISGSTLSGCVRGVDGTAAAAHASGVAVQHVVSAADVQAALREEEEYPAFIPGQAYISQHAVAALAASMENGRLRGGLFHVPRRTQFTAIGCEVVTANAAGMVRLGVYRDDGAGRPAALVLDAGEVSAASTGAKTIAIDLTLERGRYWLCAHVTGSAGFNLRFITCDARWGPQHTSATNDLGGTYNTWIGNVSQPLPDPHPTPGTLLREAPKIWLVAA